MKRRVMKNCWNNCQHQISLLLALQARRAQEKPHPLPPERGGPKGLEPTRYGDWEKKGLISDF